MDNKIENAKEIIAERLSFPKEIIMDLPKLTFIGNKEIDIENHKGILMFKEEELKIKTNFGTITIKGNNFEILFISGSNITLSGIIESVVMERHERT